MPSRCASGAKICSVSCATFCWRCGGRAPSVRMLCSRSASLIIITRRSRAIASRILRRFAADFDISWCCFLLAAVVSAPVDTAREDAESSLGFAPGRSGRASKSASLSLVTPSTKLGDLFAEDAGQLFPADPAILDDVMQQGRRQHFRPHFQICQNSRHRDGMKNIRLAAAAGLSAVLVSRANSNARRTSGWSSSTSQAAACDSIASNFSCTRAA